MLWTKLYTYFQNSDIDTRILKGFGGVRMGVSFSFVKITKVRLS